MRLPICVSLAMTCAVLAPAGALAAGPNPVGIAPGFARPPVAAQMLARRPAVARHWRDILGYPTYWLGDYWGYPAYPMGYEREALPPASSVQYFAPPLTTIYSVQRGPAQGEIGYVARPAIYDVDRALRARRSGLGRPVAK